MPKTLYRIEKGFYICIRLGEMAVPIAIGRSMRQKPHSATYWRNGSPDSYREVGAAETALRNILEKWQSGRMRQS